jgi:hypothetical protein
LVVKCEWMAPRKENSQDIYVDSTPWCWQHVLEKNVAVRSAAVGQLRTGPISHLKISTDVFNQIFVYCPARPQMVRPQPSLRLCLAHIHCLVHHRGEHDIGQPNENKLGEDHPTETWRRCVADLWHKGHQI